MKQFVQKVVQPLQRLKLSQHPTFSRSQLIFVSIEGLFVLLVSVFLISKALSTQSRQYQQYQENVVELQELEAVFNQEVLRSRYELFTSYDLLLQSLARQKAIHQELQAIPSIIDAADRTQIEAILEQKRRALAEKENASEQFKARNALLKNSLRYLPLLTSQLEEEFSAQQQAQTLEPAQVATLRSVLNRLIRNLLLYNVAVDDQLAAEIESLAQRLSELDIEYDLNADQFPTQLINSHTNVILQTKPEVEELTTRLIRSTTDAEADLDQILQESYRNVVARAEGYRLLTIVWLLGLLGLVSYWLLERSHQETARSLAGYQRKVDTMATLLVPKPASRSTDKRAVSIEKLTAAQFELAQISRDFQEHIQQFNVRKDQLQQQVLELQSQLDVAIAQQQQVEVLEEEKVLNQQILELSAALEKVKQHKHHKVEFDSNEFQVAHLSLLTFEQMELFTPEDLEHLKNIFDHVLQDQKCSLIDFQGYPQQVRLWFSCPVNTQLSELVVHVKSVSHVQLRKESTSIADKIDGVGSVWSDTYFMTVSENSDRQVANVQ